MRAIAAQQPNWMPGTQHGYHARSYGWVLGEIVRRVTGRTFGQFFAEEVAEPWAPAATRVRPPLLRAAYASIG